MPPVPSAYATVISFPLAASRVTVKVRSAEPLSPSVTLASPIDSEGSPSSSVIVPVPVRDDSVEVAPACADSSRDKVSSGSSVVSPLIGTETVLLVSPGSKVRVPRTSS